MSDTDSAALADRSRLAVDDWVERFAAFDEVEAIALGGSWKTGSQDERSDLDLEIYCRTPPPEGRRRQLIAPRAQRADLGGDAFGPGDQWIERDGRAFDIVYWTPGFIEEELDRVLVRHEARLGYSTAFWRTARDSRPLFDRSGWLARLQHRSRAPYPEELRRAVVALNHPVLRTRLSSYRDQIESAVHRRDAVSVQHRTAALLASWFDIVFALDRVPHPGEKRQLELVLRECPSRPDGCVDAIAALLEVSASAHPIVLQRVDELLDALDAVLADEGLLP